MELNEEKSDIQSSLEYIISKRDRLINKRDESIDDYLELLKVTDINNYHKIIRYREHIDRYNKQIRTLEDCIITIRLIKSGDIDMSKIIEIEIK